MRTVIIDKAVKEWAKNQGRLRCHYTDNELFVGGHDRTHRLMIGAVAQKIIYDQAIENHIPVELLLSDYKSSDHGDLKFFDPYHVADIKTAENKIRNQVHHPNTMVNIYIFCTLDTKSCPWKLQVWGWEYRTHVIARQYFVQSGEYLPGESMRQKFSDGSYIYTGELRDEMDIIGPPISAVQGELSMADDVRLQEYDDLNW